MYYSIVLSREAVMVMVTIVGTGLGLRCFTSVRRWMGRWRRMWVMGVVIMLILRYFTSMRRQMGRWRRRWVVEVIRHFTSMHRRIDRWRRRWVVGVIMVILRHFTSVRRGMRRWRRRWVIVVIVVIVPGSRCFTAVLRWMIVWMVRSRMIVRSVPAIVLGLRCWKGFRVTRRV